MSIFFPHISILSSFFLFHVVFDIEQLNLDDTNKFPDWRLTVYVELERFRCQYVHLLWWTFEMMVCRLENEHFWTRMFNVNRLLHLSEWWTEPNAQKTQFGLMKYVSFFWFQQWKSTLFLSGSMILLDNKQSGYKNILSSSAQLDSFTILLIQS